MTMDTRTTAPAAVLITRLSRVIYRYVDEGELGMTMKQYGMLNYLRDVDGITQGKLGEVIGLDANTVVLLLNGARGEGLRRARARPRRPPPPPRPHHARGRARRWSAATAPSRR